MLPVAGLALHILLLPLQAQAPPPQLPVDLNKIKIAVSTPPKLNLEDKFRFYSETVRPAPKFSDMVGSFDLFNAFNGNAVLQQNNTYGTNGASWQVPQAVLAARLAKFTVQLNF